MLWMPLSTIMRKQYCNAALPKILRNTQLFFFLLLFTIGLALYYNYAKIFYEMKG